MHAPLVKSRICHIVTAAMNATPYNFKPGRHHVFVQREILQDFSIINSTQWTRPDALGTARSGAFARGKAGSNIEDRWYDCFINSQYSTEAPPGLGEFDGKTSRRSQCPLVPREKAMAIGNHLPKRSLLIERKITRGVRVVGRESSRTTDARLTR